MYLCCAKWINALNFHSIETSNQANLATLAFVFQWVCYTLAAEFHDNGFNSLKRACDQKSEGEILLINHGSIKQLWTTILLTHNSSATIMNWQKGQ